MKKVKTDKEILEALIANSEKNIQLLMKWAESDIANYEMNLRQAKQLAVEQGKCMSVNILEELLIGYIGKR